MTTFALGEQRKASKHAWYALAILVVVYTVSFIDRQILSILAEAIKADLRLNDAQLGFLYGTAFAIFYALFGIPLGRLADSWHRPWLIAMGLVAWSAMTSFSGFAATFAMLAAARVGVGIGEASTSPAAYSLIAEYFPDKQRSLALSVYASGLYIGLGLSLPIGGFIMAAWAHNFPHPAAAPLGLSAWKATFVAVGLPGLLMALAVLTIREPRQEAARRNTGRAWKEFGRELAAILPPLTLISAARLPGALKYNLMALAGVAILATTLALTVGDAVQWTSFAVGIYAVFSWVQSLRHRDSPTYRLLFATPITIMLVVTFGSLAFITYSTGFWATPYALRTFYNGPSGPSHFLNGFTAAQEVASLVGWSSAIGSALGVITGGLVADRWRRRDVRGRLFTIAGSLLVSAPLVVVMFSTRSLMAFFILVPFATFISSSWTGAAVATIQDLVLPRMRATAGATFLLGITLVGLALGPYVAGKVGTITGSLRNGIFTLYAVAPFTLAALWFASRRLGFLEATRAQRAGESETAQAANATPLTPVAAR
jgi:MFS family permease